MSSETNSAADSTQRLCPVVMPLVALRPADVRLYVLLSALDGQGAAQQHDGFTKHCIGALLTIVLVSGLTKASTAPAAPLQLLLSKGEREVSCSREEYMRGSADHEVESKEGGVDCDREAGVLVAGGRRVARAAQRPAGRYEGKKKHEQLEL
ncbi:hypothetical protein E2C01_004551 [Portunus trituberculatus]|uniref:Uncharacterized protein n=1 Tax=Portunus trituberculatus TaxID=210409 RepID=A0A5B7CUA3_PORTR|nr:hypothetical protein [Portunus trituberculatus]